jgi:NitT/TauT family transport system substrate-binding protein
MSRQNWNALIGAGSWESRLTRRTILQGVTGVAAMSAAELIGLESSAQAQAKGGALTPIKFGVTPRVTSGAFYVGFEKGYFREEGFDVQPVEMAGQIEMLPALASGTLDAGLIAFTPAIYNAVARGAKIRVVAGRERLILGCSEQGTLFYRQDRFPKGIEKGDWKGMRVALAADTNSTRFYLQELLASRHMTEADVEVSRMRMEESVAAAIANRIDVFFGSGRPEWVQGGLPKKIRRSDMLVSILGTFQYSYVVFGARLLEGDPAVGIALLRAYLRGTKGFTAGETPKFFDDLAGRLHLEPKMVRNTCRTGTEPTGEIRAQDIERWVVWAKESKQLPDSVSPAQAVAQLIDNRFQPAAIKGL